jgi:hypothetical protein
MTNLFAGIYDMGKIMGQHINKIDTVTHAIMA